MLFRSYNFSDRHHFIPKNRIIEKIELNWDDFVIKNIKWLLDWNEGVELTLKETNFIKNWCNNNIETANFKTISKAVSFDDSTTFPDGFIAYFIKKFSFTHFDENYYLDLISVNVHFGGKDSTMIDFVEEVVGISLEKIEKRVIQNLKDGIELEDVLENHLDFCKRNEITSIQSYLVPHIKNVRLDNRERVVDSYIDLGGDKNVLEDILKNTEGYFRKELITRLIHCKSPNIEKILLDFFDLAKVEDKLDLAVDLIKLENKKALSFLVNEMKIKNRNYLNFHIIQNWSNQDALPEFLEMFVMSYDTTLAYDFKRLKSIATAGITSLVVSKKSNFSMVKRYFFKLRLKIWVVNKMHPKILTFLRIKPVSDELVQELEQYWEFLKREYYIKITPYVNGK